jgi:hypothetical protein
MRKVIVNEFLSLDGLAQAPGGAEEDPSGGFRHGGWHLRYFDESSQKWGSTELVLTEDGAAGGAPAAPPSASCSLRPWPPWRAPPSPPAGRPRRASRSTTSGRTDP